MAEIRNLTRNGETFYPLTTSSAVINEATGEGLVIDDEPALSSNNLVKSGGVFDADSKKTDYYENSRKYNVYNSLLSNGYVTESGINTTTSDHSWIAIRGDMFGKVTVNPPVNGNPGIFLVVGYINGIYTGLIRANIHQITSYENVDLTKDDIIYLNFFNSKADGSAVATDYPTEFLVSFAESKYKKIMLSGCEVVASDAYYSVVNGKIVINTAAGSGHKVVKITGEPVRQMKIVLEHEPQMSGLAFVSVLDVYGNILKTISGLHEGLSLFNIYGNEETEILINQFSGFFDNVELINNNGSEGNNVPILKEIAFINEKFNYNRYTSNVDKNIVYQGKKAVFIGDSITAGCVNSNPLTMTEDHYPKLLSEFLGMDYDNLGVNGATFTNVQSSRILSQLQDADKTCDIIFIEAGVNDWQFGATIEQIKVAVTEICTYIKNNFSTNVLTIFITPIINAGWVPVGTPKTSLYRVIDAVTETVIINDNGKFFVVQGSEFNFPTVDKGNDFISYAFGDRLHPSENGYKNIFVKSLINILGQ